jgi:hypothetical protein
MVRCGRVCEVMADSAERSTALSCCAGVDLDFYLKKEGRLEDKEARVIMMQVFR